MKKKLEITGEIDKCIAKGHKFKSIYRDGEYCMRCDVKKNKYTEPTVENIVTNW